MIEPEIPEYIMEEVEHLELTGIPRCYICKKNFVNAYDKKLKKINIHTWRPACKHYPGLRMCKG